MSFTPDPRSALSAALEHHRRGDLEAAQSLYHSVIAAHPQCAEAYHLLGVVAMQQGRNAEAVVEIERAVQLDSVQPHYFNNLGEAYRALGRLEKAIECYRRAVALDPSQAGTYCNLGSVLRELGLHSACMEALLSAVRIDPSLALGHFNLGNAYLAQEDFQAALAAYREAVRLEPRYVEAHLNMASVFQQLGRSGDALTSLRSAAQLAPQRFDIWLALGGACWGSRRVEEAMQCYHRAYDLNRSNADVLLAFAHAYKAEGRLEEAAEWFKRALEIADSAAVRYELETLLPVVLSSSEDAQRAWDRVRAGVVQLLDDRVRFEPGEDLISETFYLAHFGKCARDIQELIGRFWQSASGVSAVRSRRPRRVGERIRIGFISRHFKNHTIGFLWRGLIQLLSREKFQVILFSLGRADDPVAELIREGVEEYRELILDPRSACKRLAAEELDILVYTDIGMDPLTTSIAACRLAPVQCVSWGHPVTSGLKTIDYYLSSELLERDDAQSDYTEKLVKLKTLGLYVERPVLPQSRKERSAFNLPADAHIYGCLQYTFKFHPDHDSSLREILRRDPQGLLLIPNGTYAHWDTLLEERFQRTMPDVVDRVRFLPRQSYADYLQLLVLVDVLLVHPQFGGGRTSYEALALGTPVVTQPTPYLPGRITFGLYRAMGVMDCVAENAEQYVEIAIKLGTDPNYRAVISEKILAACSVLFEDSAAVREHERVFVDLATGVLDGCAAE